MRLGLLATIVCAGAMVTASTSCTPGEQRPGVIVPSPPASRRAPRTGEPTWPYWPTAMRIHPLSRLVTDGDAGRPLIEARVEMRDREGDLAKAWGLLRLDLYDASDESPAGSRAEWNLDLRDPHLNRKRFDDVTFTYLFRLEIDEEEIPAQPVLRAYYLSDDGTDLTARFAMRGMPEG